MAKIKGEDVSLDRDRANIWVNVIPKQLSDDLVDRVDDTERVKMDCAVPYVVVTSLCDFQAKLGGFFIMP